jgi:RHS repeat-associated protein
MLSRKKGWVKLNSVTLVLALIFTTLGTGGWTSITNTPEQQGIINRQAVELPQYRNQTTKVYSNPDGTYTAEISSEPVHYRDGNKWVDIDNSLVPAADKTSLANKKNKFTVQFPKTSGEANSNRLFDYSISGHDISFDLAGNPSSSAQTFANPANTQRTQEKEKVSYAGIYPGVKFEYVVDGSKVKENIVLDSYQGKNTFEFFIKGTGLNAVKKDNGYIEFTDKASGDFLFNIPKPFMVDSNKENGPAGVANMNVDQKITAVKGGFLLTITADEAFLKDSQTVYPVTIDPWIDYFSGADTYIASGNDYNYNTNGWLYVGHDATIGKTRSLVKWDTLPNIPDATVVNAKIGLMKQHAYDDIAPVNVHQVLTNYDVKEVRWADRPDFKSTPENTVSTFTGNYDYFNVTDLVKYWYNNPGKNYGVMFKYDDNAEDSHARITFHSMDWVNPDGSQIGKPKLVVTFMPTERLGLTDYWEYTPDLFYGTGSGAVNVLNGNLVFTLPVVDPESRAYGFGADLTYNSRQLYDTGDGWGWIMSSERKLIINDQKNIIQYQDASGAEYIFAKHQDDSATSYKAPEGTYFEMNSTSNPEGYTIKQPDNTVLYFDSQGRNTKIQDEKGNITNYIFDSVTGRLKQIQERHTADSTGRNINIGAPQYTYDQATGRVAQMFVNITGVDNELTQLTYDNANGVFVLSAITYPYTAAADKKVIHFSYDNETKLLTNITDGDGNKSTIRYDSSNRVSKVYNPQSETVYSSMLYPPDTAPDQTQFIDANGNTTTYKSKIDPNHNQLLNIEEITNKSPSGQGETTSYVWDSNRLTEITEPNGTVHTIAYEQGNPVKIKNIATLAGNLKVSNSYNANYKIQQISTNGTFSIQDLVYDSSGNIVSASNNYRLTNTATYDNYGNNLSTTTPTRATFNRLQNSNFEIVSGSYPATWTRRAYGQYSLATDHAAGKQSGKITLSASDGAGYYTQRVAVDPDESEKGYTVAAYVKTTEVTSGVGANLRVYPLDAGGNYLYDSQSQVIKYTSPTVSGKDWTRISMDLSLPSNTVNIQVDLLFTGQGSVYFDGAQLVYGQMLDNYYSNENGGMEWGTSPDTWTLNSLGTGDGKSNEQKKRGNYSFKVTGTSASKYFGQYVEAAGAANTPLTLSGWAYTTGANPNGGDFALEVIVMNNDGTETISIIPFNKSLTGQWQMIKTTIKPARDFKRLRIYGLYYNQTGTAYFDNIKLEENGSLSSTTYDPASYGNYVSSQTDELNKTTQYTSDSNGNIKSITDPAGKISSFVYDRLSRIKQAVLKGSSSGDISAEYEYDQEGNLKQRTDPLGHVTAYTVNEMNKALTETDPLGKSTEYQYDNNGNLKSVKKVQNDTVISTIEYKNFDYKNRPTEKWVDGKKKYAYTYDKDDPQKVQVFDSNGNDLGMYNVAYDANHRLDTTLEPDGYQLDNNYGTGTGTTDNSLRTKYTETVFGQPKITQFFYDNLQRLYKIINPQSVQSQFYYDERGLLVRISNGSTTPVDINQGYDDAGRLESQTVTGSWGMDQRYAYYANDELKNYTVNGILQSFEYDGANRLTKWTNNGNATSYVYDAAGNLKNPHSKNLSFNDANEIIGFNYDGAGNLTQDDKYNYTWNSESQLINVNKPDGSLSVTYTYDPSGLRKSKTVTDAQGTKTYKYYYDGSDLIRVTDGTKTLWTYTWAGGKPVSMTDQNNVTYYPITNYRGDVVQIVDTAGAVKASYSYDPYGKVLSAGETVSTLVNQPLRYASYAYDTETGLYYLQARYYDTDTARFISRDLAGGSLDNPLSQNAYAYVNDDPVNNVDPSGCWTFSMSIITVSGGFGIGGSYTDSVAIDDKGNVMRMRTVGLGGTTPNGGVGIQFTRTNADKVDDLLGLGMETGMTLFFLTAEYTAGDRKLYEGGSVTAGWGVIPIDAHGYITQTWEIPMTDSEKEYWRKTLTDVLKDTESVY